MIVSIDIETTGLDPERHSVLEIAAVWRENGTVKIATCFVKQTEVFGNLVALNMNKDAIAQIVNGEGIEESEVSEFLDSKLPDNYIVAGANFDARFLRKLGWEPKCHHRIIDVGNLYWDKKSDKLPGIQKCMNIAGFGTIKHDAVSDAVDVLRLVENLR